MEFVTVLLQSICSVFENCHSVQKNSGAKLNFKIGRAVSFNWMILDDTTDGKVLLGKRNRVWGIDEQKRAKNERRIWSCQWVDKSATLSGYAYSYGSIERILYLLIKKDSEKEKGSDDTRFTFALSLVDEVYQLFAVLRLFLGTTIVINEV